MDVIHINFVFIQSSLYPVIRLHKKGRLNSAHVKCIVLGPFVHLLRAIIHANCPLRSVVVESQPSYNPGFWTWRLRLTVLHSYSTASLSTRSSILAILEHSLLSSCSPIGFWTPRLEYRSCTIGVRLSEVVKRAWGGRQNGPRDTGGDQRITRGARRRPAQRYRGVGRSPNPEKYTGAM